MELAREPKASLREFSAAAPVEVRENGGRVARLASLSWEVRGAAEKPLIHLWSAEHNLTRRVLAITDYSVQHLILAVERFGRSKPDRLEFVRVNFERSERDTSRRAFCEQLRRILGEQFPDEVVESLTISQDLEHSLSGNYARGILRRGSTEWAVLGVGEGESAYTIENSLTFALLWLEPARQSSRRGTIAGLRLILPKAVPALWHNASERYTLDCLWNFMNATRCVKYWKNWNRAPPEILTVGSFLSGSRNRCSIKLRVPSVA
jgi:hypothetical protein